MEIAGRLATVQNKSNKGNIETVASDFDELTPGFLKTVEEFWFQVTQN